MGITTQAVARGAGKADRLGETRAPAAGTLAVQEPAEARRGEGFTPGF